MNNFFQFKQFIIQQDQCAMKVCTDACLFGAYIANKLQTKNIFPKNILDIGTGTGLLSLILAQKKYKNIDAVELDEKACKQALQNIEDSIFKDQINIFNANIITFTAKEKYDFIICNPPFFENQLRSIDDKRNAAMHATTLSFVQLIKVIKQHLSANGTASLLLPNYAVEDFSKTLFTENLFVMEQVNIKHAPSKNFFRTILTISFVEKNMEEKEIAIKNTGDEYSNEFVELLKDYYLKL
jgi:tRNA1Val (adenine37-N6)-methyltransferase